jgi:AmmeMemoRadiSam system protein B
MDTKAQFSTGLPRQNFRPPAVAGVFYPGDAETLRRDVEGLLAGWVNQDAPPKALIVPHAGHAYSGAIAASAYRLLAPLRKTIGRVILLGPAHRVRLQGLALPSVSAFATPLGRVPIDQQACQALTDIPAVLVSDEAHREEHCLEVQLPFLQVMLEDFSLVPLLVGQCAPATVGSVIDRLWGGPETLIVISSDLSHYLPYTEAQRTDAVTSQRILGRATDLSGEAACGAAAINGLMAAQQTRPLRIDLLDLRNSGDTAGDRSRVVGYGAYALA